MQGLRLSSSFQLVGGGVIPAANEKLQAVRSTSCGITDLDFISQSGLGSRGTMSVPQQAVQVHRPQRFTHF